MLQRLRSFTLKEKDFSTGKMISPPREFWLECDCCGKAIVQGVVMSNGDKIGNDCFEVYFRTAGREEAEQQKTFTLFRTPKRVINYINAN